MKNVMTFIMLLISFQLIIAQEFIQNNKYTITKAIQNKGQEYPPYMINVMRSGEVSEKVANFVIEDTELLEGIFISTLDQPGLEGVQEVLKIEVEYLACCAHVDVYYFVVTEEEDFIALPMLENVYCDIGDSDVKYTFPNQEYGIQGNILRTEQQYTNTATIKYVRLQQSFVWNDNTYDAPEVIAYTTN